MFLRFHQGITILVCQESTDEGLKSLLIFDIIKPECKWNAKALPSEEFNLQLCNQVLNLREQRRAQVTNTAPGSLWDEQDITSW